MPARGEAVEVAARVFGVGEVWASRQGPEGGGSGGGGWAVDGVGAADSLGSYLVEGWRGRMALEGLFVGRTSRSRLESLLRVWLSKGRWNGWRLQRL